MGPHDLWRLTLRPEQLLVVNCPGQVDARSTMQIPREFVAGGGSLSTTDLGVREVIEPAFPGVLAYNERPTADAVVRVEVVDADLPRGGALVCGRARTDQFPIRRTSSSACGRGLRRREEQR